VRASCGRGDVSLVSKPSSEWISAGSSDIVTSSRERPARSWS
jgi:hypothetical protein